VKRQVPARHDLGAGEVQTDFQGRVWRLLAEWWGGGGGDVEGFPGGGWGSGEGVADLFAGEAAVFVA